MNEFTHLNLTKGVDLWHHQRTQVKSIVLRLTLADGLEEGRAGANAMAMSMLKRGTASFPSLTALSKVTEELYGTSTRVNILRSGKRQQLSLSLRFPAPAFLPQGTRVFRKIVDLARELIFEPALVDGSFNQEVFASEHDQLLRAIESLKDNRAGWAMRRARQCALPDSPFSISEYGSEAAVSALDVQATTKAWRRLITSAPLAIHMVGNFDPKKHVAVLAEAFAPYQRSKLIRLPKHASASHVARAGSKREKMDGEQEHSVLLFTTELSTGTKDWSAMRVANSIFGRDASSRLFRQLREVQGLAYTVTSVLSPMSGILAVYAGTDADQAKATIDGAKTILKELQRSGITDAELDTARRTLLEEVYAAADSLSGRVSRHLSGLAIDNVRSLEEVEAELHGVTKEDVERVLRGVRPLYTYRLGP